MTKSNYFDGPGSYAYGKQLPAKLAPGVTSRIVLSMAENLSAGPFPLQACELRVGFRALPEGAKVAIALNGKPIFEGPTSSGARVVTKQLVKTPPRQPDQAEEYLHVPLAAGSMPVRGANEFSITVAGATKPVEVTDLEVRYDYHNDLEKIWNRVPVR